MTLFINYTYAAINNSRVIPIYAIIFIISYLHGITPLEVAADEIVLYQHF